ncbi:male accessory gland serine protease inhibitor-like [Drosophila miranda]|uniref:male accessory gland serine protease inhibitor-like n=1 Tax=Drosophila miranda TaxID=7229 RepID=UPI0007E635F5|nr:male accessory gland serine protease inhibitor-like [Drosophila miranda]
MKLIFIVGIIFALSGAALGLKDAVCGQPPEVSGRCRGLFPSFTYHPDKNECTEFNYGGCDGNENRFFLKEDCEAKCKE